MRARESGVNRLRLLALEAIAIAEQMTHAEAKASMLSVATGYDHLAELLEKHAELMERLGPTRSP